MHRYLQILPLFSCSISQLPAQAVKLDELPITRITREGPDLRFDNGFLSAPSGEVRINYYEMIPERTFADTAMTPAVVTRINGKLLVEKFTIDNLRKRKGDAYLDRFRFSSRVYPAGPYGEDCYLVTLPPATAPALATVSVKASTPRLKEGPKTSATVAFTLDKPATADIPVFFKFTGTAKIASDYVSSRNTGSVTIRKGKQSAGVKITLKNDNLREPKEKLIITLVYRPTYNRARTTAATIDIADDDK